MKSNFNKIVLVSLADNLTKQVALLLSATLGMMFCDAEDLVEYELMDKDNLKKIASKKYLDNSEKKVAKHISSFENVVVKIGFDLFFHNNDIISQNAVVFFLDFPESLIEKTPHKIAFSSRKAHLKKNCDFCLAFEKFDEKFICDKIIEILGGLV